MENEVTRIVEAFLSQKKANADKNGKTASTHYDTPAAWLNFVSLNAKDISVGVSHVGKLTHSSSKSSNISFVNSFIDKPCLSTQSLQNPIFDYSYSNAAFAAVAEFLQLECQNKLLGKWLIEQPKLFEQFTQDKAQIDNWKTQIAIAFNTTQAKSHVLAKQVYFPVAESYHLLAPLISSSLAHRIFEKIYNAKDSATRKARNKGLYHQETDTIFHRVAIQMVTQSQHQNASNLNGKRNGRLFLLASAPPQWQVQTKSPTKTFFNKSLAYRAKEPLEELRNLLITIKFQELSLNLERKKLIIQHINTIADIVFDSVIEIHQIQTAGWSATSNLKLYEQYWLDPYRTDENFQKNRQDSDWSSDILSEFSRWINKNLESKTLSLGTEKENLWQKILTEPLREFNACIDADMPQIGKEI